MVFSVILVAVVVGFSQNEGGSVLQDIDIFVFLFLVLLFTFCDRGRRPTMLLVLLF